VIPPTARLAIAREYLAGARRRKVGQLPPTLLVRELAETRRQLGEVLDVLGPAAAVLDEDQAAIVLAALADAAELLEHRAGEWCSECEFRVEGCCPKHLEDLDAASRYRELAREIGGQR
jgi:hypothetical protein